MLCVRFFVGLISNQWQVPAVNRNSVAPTLALLFMPSNGGGGFGGGDGGGSGTA